MSTHLVEYGKLYHYLLFKKLKVESRLNLFVSMAGSVVGRVEAIDRDSNPDFRRIFYFIDNSDEDSSKLFSLDAATGQIHTRAVLDRETTNSPLTLRVSAAAGPEAELTSRASRCDVIVDVADENDNAPRFVFPNAVNHTALVNPEVLQVGQRLTRLDAVDRDVGVNAELTYFLQEDDQRPLGLDVKSTSGVSNVSLSIDFVCSL